MEYLLARFTVKMVRFLALCLLLLLVVACFGPAAAGLPASGNADHGKRAPAVVGLCNRKLLQEDGGDSRLVATDNSFGGVKAFKAKKKLCSSSAKDSCSPKVKKMMGK